LKIKRIKLIYFYRSFHFILHNKLHNTLHTYICMKYARMKYEIDTTTNQQTTLIHSTICIALLKYKFRIVDLFLMWNERRTNERIYIA